MSDSQMDFLTHRLSERCDMKPVNHMIQPVWSDSKFSGAVLVLVSTGQALDNYV